MSKAKLADLVTQVPDDDDELPQIAAPPQSGKAVRRFCGLCRFAFPGKSSNQVPKLASVLPTATEQEDREDKVPKRQEQPPAATPSAAAPAAPLEPDQVTAAPEREASHLGPQVGKNVGRKTLVLDLDETLVHSSVRAVPNADIVITVELEGENHHVYVRKRPGVDEFLLQAAVHYEIVVYTASMAKYANPLLDELDQSGVISWRLFREACTRYSGGYVKDLSRLGRDLRHVIILDNSPTCYALQPDNAIPIKTWKDDMSDRELLDLIPILNSLAGVDDVPFVLRQIVWAADNDLEEEPDQ